MSSKRLDTVAGILIIDKPQGVTSFKVVQEVRRLLHVQKAGHTGTLDPLATGVLPICLGEATKIAGLLTADDKAYLAEALLGIETDSYDIEGKIVQQSEVPDLSIEDIEAVANHFKGAMMQRPPAFSAIKIQGKRACDLVRKGASVDLQARQIIVHSLNITSWKAPRLTFRLECSKGTYVRSLVFDLGRAFGCGATLASLRRIRSGRFDESGSIPLEKVSERAAMGNLVMISMDEALNDYLAVELDGQQTERIRMGQFIACDEIDCNDGLFNPQKLVRIKFQGKLVALGEVKDGRLKPNRVFRSFDA